MSRPYRLVIVNDRDKRRGFSHLGVIRWSIAFLFLIFSLLQCRAQVTPQETDVQQTQPQQQPTQSPQVPAAHMAVRGTVINSATGEPLARALVSIEGDASSAKLTDGEGHFEFQNLATGPQVFSVKKPGFSGENSGVDRGGDLIMGGELERNVIVAPEMTELTFALTPDSAIHGHLELSTGDPGDNVQVQLIRKNIVNGRAQWSVVAMNTTNSSGNYRFAGLSTGIYMVQTLPSKDADTFDFSSNAANSIHLPVNGFPATYYSESRAFSNAAQIQLKAGEETQANLNLTLEAFQPVVVKVPHSEAQADRESQSRNSLIENVSITDESGDPAPYHADYNTEKHQITTHLPDGIYIMYLAGLENMASKQDVSSRIRMGAISFAVEGHAVSNVSLPIGPAEPVTVHLRLPDSVLRQSSTVRNGAPTVFVNFAHANGPAQDMSQFGSAMQDSITYRPGTAGRYWANVTPERSGVCAGSFTAGGADLAREPLVLSPSVAPPQLELTLRDDCAKLNLNLPYGASMILPGVEASYSVYVVPDFDSAATVTPLTLRASSGSTVTLESLTPGNYHIYTFTSPKEFEYHNPQVLQEFTGQAITLAPSSTVDVMLEVPEK
jgi:hypothetical protein